MCTWQRIDRFPLTLAALSEQNCSSFEFYVWNNNPGYREKIDSLVSTTNLPFPIKIFHSPENIGAFGRFEICRSLRKPQGRDYPFAAFIDDDQELLPDMVKTIRENARPETVISQWAFRLQPGYDYWQRRRCKSGETAHYCGTGGMICDMKLFDDPEFFTRCPNRFRFVEDLWLSYYADAVLGWELKCDRTLGINTNYDGLDSFARIFHLKIEFLEYLRNQGWKV